MQYFEHFEHMAARMQKFQVATLAVEGSIRFDPQGVAITVHLGQVCYVQQHLAYTTGPVNAYEFLLSSATREDHPLGAPATSLLESGRNGQDGAGSLTDHSICHCAGQVASHPPPAVQANDNQICSVRTRGPQNLVGG